MMCYAENNQSEENRVSGMGWDCFGRGFKEMCQERDLEHRPAGWEVILIRKDTGRERQEESNQQA